MIEKPGVLSKMTKCGYTLVQKFWLINLNWDLQFMKQPEMATLDSMVEEHSNCSDCLDVLVPLVSSDKNADTKSLSNRIAWGFPSIGVQLSLVNTPREDLVKRSNKGSLPLHIACRDLNNDTLLLPPGHPLKQYDQPLLLPLVDANPDAAKYLDGVDGRLPLSLAVSAFGDWLKRDLKRNSDAMDTLWFPRTSKSGMEDAIIRLARAAPKALKTRDMKTGIYPVMEAASNSDHSVDFVYKLLLEDPAVIERAVVTTEYEEYLENRVNSELEKMERTKRRIQELQEQLGEHKDGDGHGHDQAHDADTNLNDLKTTNNNNDNVKDNAHRQKVPTIDGQAES